MAAQIHICPLNPTLKRRWLETLPQLEQTAKKAVVATLTEVMENPNDPQFQVAILLADDAELKALNHKWRGKNSPTDVLSFADGDGGNIAVSLERLLAQAEQDQINKEAYFGWLIIHATLHLCGFRHEKPVEAEMMQKIELVATKTAFGITPPIELAWSVGQCVEPNLSNPIYKTQPIKPD